jgi:flavodoxin
MKTGMIIYSQTGNTLHVAKRIKEKMKGMDIEQITVEGINTPDIKLVNIPKVEEYDSIIFGAPVQAFSLCLPMKKYFDQLPSLKDKNVICFVTEGFSKPWLGGNRAIKHMRNVIETKGGKIIDTGIINWGNKEKENQIVDFINKVTKD